MSTLSMFFKGSDTRFGVFYPTDYLVATYRDDESAAQAKRVLFGHNLSDEDVVAVPGTEVVQFAQEHLQKDGLWGLLMTKLSQAFDTEAGYAVIDLDRAKEGAAFLAVYCPTENAKNKVWSWLAPTNPWAARHYSTGGIEHLVGEG